MAGNGTVPSTLVIFPGALGDFICFLPALAALADRHPSSEFTLMAKDELVRLAIGRTPITSGVSINRREVALLFSDDLDASARAAGMFEQYSNVYSFFGFNHQLFRRNLAAA